jgi:hypothetical protein
MEEGNEIDVEHKGIKDKWYLGPLILLSNRGVLYGN